MPERILPPERSIQDVREAVKNTAPIELLVGRTEWYGLPVADRIFYSPAEVIRANENAAFGQTVVEGFKRLVEAQAVDEKYIREQLAEIARELSPSQRERVAEIAERVVSLLKKKESRDDADVLREAINGFQAKFGLSAAEMAAIKFERTALGAVLVKVESMEVWRAIVKAGGGQGVNASVVGGFVAGPPGGYMHMDAALRDDFLDNQGNLVILNLSGIFSGLAEVRTHELTHWLNHRATLELRSAAPNRSAGIFEELKDELLAYAAGGRWPTSMSQLMGSFFGARRGSGDIVKSIAELSWQDAYAKQMRVELRGLGAPEEVVHSSGSTMRRKYDQWWSQNTDGEDRVRLRKAYDEAEEKARESADQAKLEAATATAVVNVELGRLKLQGSKDFSKSLAMIIGAQSFKELALQLRGLDPRPERLDVMVEFGKTSAAELSLDRIEATFYLPQKFDFKVRNLDLLADKVRERIAIMRGLSDLTLDESQELASFEEVLKYFEDNPNLFRDIQT